MPPVPDLHRENSLVAVFDALVHLCTSGLKRVQGHPAPKRTENPAMCAFLAHQDNA
jgi:hypothetical protein